MIKSKFYSAIIIIIILFNSINAQNIELPDFVITGVQAVNIPTLQKKRPELFTSLSKEFIKPNYSPEELSISEPSDPIKVEAELYKEVIPINGSLSLAAGINTQPKGEAYFYNNFDKINLFSKVWGNYTPAYEYNSDLSITGLQFTSRYFLDNKNEILPGLEVLVGANYLREWYKKFISSDPEYLLKIQTGNAKLLIENTYLKDLNFGFSLKGGGLFTNKDDFKEMRYDGSGYFTLTLNKLVVSVNGYYIKQQISLFKTNKWHYDYFSTKASLKYSPVNNLSFGAGLNLSKYDSNSFFRPLIFVEMRLNKFLSVACEFAPNTEFYTVSDFYKENRYISFEKRDNIYLENKSKLNLSIKFENAKLFEIYVGFEFKSRDNQYYYSDENEVGSFDILQTNDVQITKLFSNYYLNFGAYGELYGDVIYQDARMEGQLVLPYTPAFILNTSYKYFLQNDLSIIGSLEFNHQIYADYNNTKKLPDYINFSVHGEYQLLENLSLNLYLENIINNKNYRFINYLEKPLDIYAGINYRW
ncbi:MAG: hypothetical protein V1773_04445 [bacterium]